MTESIYSAVVDTRKRRRFVHVRSVVMKALFSGLHDRLCSVELVCGRWRQLSRQRRFKWRSLRLQFFCDQAHVALQADSRRLRSLPIQSTAALSGPDEEQVRLHCHALAILH